MKPLKNLLVPCLVLMGIQTANAANLYGYIGSPVNLGADKSNAIGLPVDSYADITIAGGSTLDNYSTFRFKTGCDTCEWGLTVFDGRFNNWYSGKTTFERQTFLRNQTLGRVFNYNTIDNYGKVTSEGSITNDGLISNFASSTFENRSGASLVNNGRFVVDAGAVISNAGANSSRGAGVIENNGAMTFAKGSTVNSWGSVLNNDGNWATGLSVAGFFNNAGTIVNDRVLSIDNDVNGLYKDMVPRTGEFNNYGSLTNNGVLNVGTAASRYQLGGVNYNSTQAFNNGLIDNRGHVEQSGKLINWKDGNLVNRSGSDITYYLTDGLIWNYGNLTNERNGYISQVEVRNFGVTENDGYLSVGGMYYQNGGVTVNNGTLWASEIGVVDGLYTGNGRASSIRLMGAAEFTPGDLVDATGSTHVGMLEGWGQFIFDIAGQADFDQLFIDNSAWFHKGGGVEFRFADSYAEKIGDRWEFISAQNGLYDFELLNFRVTGLAAGTGWEIQESADGRTRSLVITSVQPQTTDVPEPASAALVLSGLGLLGVARRRSGRTSPSGNTDLVY